MSSSRKKKTRKRSTNRAPADGTSRQDAARQVKLGSFSVLSGRWPTNLVTFSALVLGTVLLYAGDLRLDFFRVDDQQYVVNNPWIRGFTFDNLRHVFTTPYFVNYSPLHLLSYTLDYVLAGLSPLAFHLSSNIWAGLVAGSLFLVALALTRQWSVAAAAAALFVVHPAHVEAIVWISSRKDLVAAAFALPSFLMYLQYRRASRKAKWWYAVSVLLFVLALLGKLSVATFPAVFLTHDLFVEKRFWRNSLLDKVPFVLAAGVVALFVAGAQPATGAHPNAWVLLAALAQNCWLLTGFGTYVIYRVPPDPAGAFAQLGATICLVGVFVVPLLIRHRWPRVVVLVYWILFSLIPSQVLSFAYPVTDRYLFFPSTAAVILVAWGILALGERFGRRGLAGALMILFVLGFVWTKKTLAYVSEWRDPRSVWYAAAAKSADPLVYYNLGWHYADAAARLGDKPRKPRLEKEQAERFAAAVWPDDQRRGALFAEWSAGQHGGPAESAFQSYVRNVASDAFEKALAMKGRHIMPELYFQRGLMHLDRGQLQEARAEFLNAVDESARSTFTEGRQEILVNSHNDLGIVAWTEGNYREALQWLRLAEQEQTEFGGNWVPDISANRQRLEAIIATLPRS